MRHCTWLSCLNLSCQVKYSRLTYLFGLHLIRPAWTTGFFVQVMSNYCWHTLSCVCVRAHTQTSWDSTLDYVFWYCSLHGYSIWIYSFFFSWNLICCTSWMQTCHSYLCGVLYNLPQRRKTQICICVHFQLIFYTMNNAMFFQYAIV